MDAVTLELRSMVGTPVWVETATRTVHGMLLSCTRSSLWLVDGEEDVVLPLPSVRAVHPGAARGRSVP
jgi:hypothetical protein